MSRRPRRQPSRPQGLTVGLRNERRDAGPAYVDPDLARPMRLQRWEGRVDGHHGAVAAVIPALAAGGVRPL